MNKVERKAESWGLGQSTGLAIKTGDTEPASARGKDPASQFRTCPRNLGKNEQVRGQEGGVLGNRAEPSQPLPWQPSPPLPSVPGSAASPQE